MAVAYRGTADLKRVIPNWQSLSFLVSLIFAQFYVWINYRGEGVTEKVMLVYILLPVAFITYLFASSHISRKAYSLDELRLLPMMAFGLLGFILSWAATVLLLGELWGQTFGSLPVTALWGTILTQVLFVAASEELVFRYVLPSYLLSAWPNFRLIAILFSQASFALFHWSVYGGNTSSLMIAFIFGMLMYGAYHVKLWKGGPKLGLGFTIGAHAAYNLVLVGVLAGPGHIITLVGGG